MVSAATTNGSAAKPASTGIRGILTPEMRVRSASGGGRRSASAADKSTTRPTMASSVKSQRRMPSPRISIRPANSRAGRTTSCPVLASRWTRSSPTSTAAGICPERPARMRSNASRDLPAPDGPRISTARFPTSTAEAWTLAPAASVTARAAGLQSAPPQSWLRHRGRRDLCDSPPRCARHAPR